MNRWFFYTVADGLFTGQSFGGPAAFLASNTPAGCDAWPGPVDWASSKVQGGALVDYQPPAPQDSELATWQWNAATKRYVSVETAAGAAARVRADRDARLLACDWVVARAMEQGAAVPADWLAYRAALRNVPEQADFPNDVTWPASPAA